MNKITCPVIAAVMSLCSGVASASSVTMAGTDVSFTFDDALLGLYGTPTVSGNTISFVPPDFRAVSTNGMGTVLTTSTINIAVIPNQDMSLSSLGFEERGDYSLNGEGSYVEVGGQVRVFDIDNPIAVEDTANISSSSDLTLNDSTPHPWTAAVDIDLSSAKWQNSSAFNFTIENVLGATTVSEVSKAFIDKEFAGLSFIATVEPPSAVPVPAAAWLLGSGLAGFVAVGRRRGGKISQK